MTLTIAHDIVSHTGRIILHQGDKVEGELVRSQAYWGKQSSTYYPERVIGVHLSDFPGLWLPGAFLELGNIEGDKNVP